jgi:cytochrome c oxidase cbb3-type subunit 3
MSALDGEPSSSSPSASGPRHGAPQDDLLDHEYDGIREYDNPLPGWWKKLFWASFVFSLGYLFHYHLSGKGLSIGDAYANEMALVHAEQAKKALAEAPSEESLGTLMLDATLMAEAKALFAARCTACHGDRGQGGIGPNLTDGYFIHGKNTLLDIFQTVTNGIPEKGMPAWSLQLRPAEVRAVAAFVGTLRGTNVPGKGPEGQPIAVAP